MATTKKAKGKRTKATGGKTRKKTVKAAARKKKPAKVAKTRARKPAKKAPARRAAPRRAKPIARATGKPTARAPARPTTAGAPARPSTARPAPSPAPREERVGVVTHYYNHLSVAIVKLESGTLRVGDTIHIRGHTTDFSQKVESLEVDHAAASEVGPNDDFGLKVVDHAREHDVVYKVRQ
jgi:hypothetical protein